MVMRTDAARLWGEACSLIAKELPEKDYETWILELNPASFEDDTLTLEAPFGLFRDRVLETEKKVPLLGDIPLLGALFRSTRELVTREEIIVVLTPHIASASVATRRAMADLAATNLIAALAGERPPNLLNSEALGRR